MPPAQPKPAEKSSWLGRVSWNALGFYAICALVVLVASFSLYLERRIRAMQAEIAQREIGPTGPLGTSPLGGAHATSQVAAPAPQDGWSEQGRWQWVTDPALVTQQARQAAASIGYDRALNRAASNQIKVRLRFHELYRILGLSPAEIAVFEQEAADRNLTFAELVSSDPQALQEHAQGQVRAMDGIVQHTLGPEYVEPFRLFLATSDLRDLTAELAVHTLGTGEPLTRAQAQALLQASLEQRRSGNRGNRIDPAEIDWEAVAVRARDFLTPAQQGILRAMIDRRQFDQTYREITGLPMRRPTRGL